MGVVCGIAERAARALFRRLTRASNSPQDGEITPEEFQVALEKLDAGRNILSLDEEGISDLVDKFDKDGDGTISMQEFKHYCYNINALCWKAERVRLEAAGEFVGFTDEKSPKTHDHEFANAEVQQTKQKAVTAALFHESTKLFWRTNDKVELSLYECETMHVLCVAG